MTSQYLLPSGAFSALWMLQNAFVVGSPSRSPLENLTALPRPLAGGEGVAAPPPNPTPLSAFGLSFRHFRFQAAALEREYGAARWGSRRS